MTIKLVDVELNTRMEETGSCDLCMGIQEISEPIFIWEYPSGKRKRIEYYSWSYGHYDEPFNITEVDNVIAFADYINQINLKTVPDDCDLECIIEDYVKWRSRKIK
jgi:hypothetical protein